eukprot:symbB.v1.2.029451.t1/scaffold3186.1/size61749/4
MLYQLLVLLLPQRLSAFPVVEVSTSSLGLRLPDGETFQLDPLWLRERCLSKSSVDSITLQPLWNPHELPLEMSIQNASLDNNTIKVAFTDGHISEYKLEALVKELSDFRHSPIQPLAYKRPKPMVWSGDYKMNTYNYHEVLNNEETKLKLTSDLLIAGAALIDGVPKEHGIVIEFGKNLSTLRQTEWGPFFNVRTKPDAALGAAKRDLAYTPRAIGFHTDNPYRDPTPDFQLLHALEHCSCENEVPCEACSVLNYLVDGFYIAQELQKENPENFDLLSDVPVRFENNGGDGSSALIHVAPHLELDVADTEGKKALKVVRFSAKSGQYAPPLDLQTTSKFYKARRRFSELAHEPKHAVTMQFKPGQILVFDNRRILHARSHILPSDGERWVQGAYIDRDGLWLAFERLRRLKEQHSWE